MGRRVRRGRMIVTIGLPIVIGVALIVAGVARGGSFGWALLGAGILSLGLIAYGIVQMRRVDPSSWVITWDVPEALQFCAYVGQREGFAVDDAAVPQSQTEREWRAWWDELPQQIFAHHADIEDIFLANTDLAPIDLLQRLGAPHTVGYDPPNFTALAATPALQALCRQHWLRFGEVWQAEKPVAFEHLRRQGGIVREERIVRARVQAIGKATAPHFLLRLDFVRWPESYHRRVSEQQLVLGLRYLHADQVDALRALIASAVADLIVLKTRS